LKQTGSAGQEAHVYCGELFYADREEQIDVSRFIVREKAISFDLVTEVDLGGHWAFNGVAEQVPRQPRLYAAAHVIGNEIVGNTRGEESGSIRFEFEIKKQSEVRLEVGGRWSSGGAMHAFSGTLKKYRPPNR